MNTITSSQEISNIFLSGKRYRSHDITFIVLQKDKQRGHNGRVAFIAGKKLGNAVWRNRAKRRMRSVCLDIGGPIDGMDIIFLARKSVTESLYADIVEGSKKALAQLLTA